MNNDRFAHKTFDTWSKYVRTIKIIRNCESKVCEARSGVYLSRVCEKTLVGQLLTRSNRFDQIIVFEFCWTSSFAKYQQHFVFKFCKYFKEIQTHTIWNKTFVPLLVDFEHIFSDIRRCPRKCRMQFQFPEPFPLFPLKSDCSGDENAKETIAYLINIWFSRHTT